MLLSKIYYFWPYNFKKPYPIMRNLKSLQFYKVAIFMGLLVIFSSSCKKDAPVLPNYAGTWVASGYLLLDTEDSIPMKENMTFTEKTFSDLMQVKVTNGQYVDYMKVKGSMTFNGNIMNITANEIAISAFNMVTNMPTGQMTSYQSGSAEFDSFFSNSGQSKTFKSEYSVSGNQLTLKTDNNGNGNYLDANETTVYTRQ